jgi:hypothetical protein
MLAGRIEIELGQLDDARVHLDSALMLARRISAGNLEAQSLNLLGQISAAEGKMDEARRYADQAVDVVRKVGMTFIGPAVLAAQAALLENPARRRDALKEAEEILDSGCVAHNHFWFAQTAIDQALAAGEWDEAERYAHRLEKYMHDEPLAWPEFTAARGRALASWGRGSREEALVAELQRLRNVAADAGLVRAAIELERVSASVM